MKQTFVLSLLLLALCISACIALRAKSKAKSKSRNKGKLNLGLQDRMSMSARSKIQTMNDAPAEEGGDSEPEPEGGKTIVKKGWLNFLAVPQIKWKTPLPEKFEINPTWAVQIADPVYQMKQKAKVNSTVKGSDLDKAPEADEFGSFEIPSETSFFFVLTKMTIYAVTARQNDLARTRKSLEIKWLIPYTLDDDTGIFGKGLQDLGNFEYGCCWRIIASNNAYWDMCSLTLKDKSDWMGALASVMRKEQKEAAQPAKIPEGFSMTGSSKDFDDQEEQKAGSKSVIPVNGKWILLQDWTACNLACGGGEMFLHQICQPPKNGGQPCVGKELQTKPCNTQPCPTTGPEQPKILPPVVKMSQLSSRPQRYEECVVREGDMNMKVLVANKKDGPIMPCRVVLNPKTISIFSAMKFETVITSFDLRYTNIEKSGTDPDKCFVLSDKRDQYRKIQEICIMATALRSYESFLSAQKSWIQDIYFFRDKCALKPQWRDLTVDESPERDQMEADVQQRKIERLQDLDMDQLAMKNAATIKGVATVATNALGKEMKYERLILQEEMQREQYEQMQMDKQMEDAKNKEACLTRARLAKEQAGKAKQLKLETDNKVNKIKSNAKIQVSGAREAITKRIEKMKKEFERKRELKKAQIMEVRSKIANDMFDANAKGDLKDCNNNRPIKEKTEFCHTKINETAEQILCLNKRFAGFCPICCQNTFGTNYPEEREKCFQYCDDNPTDMSALPEAMANAANPTPNLNANANNGWTFVPNKNSMNGQSRNNFDQADPAKVQKGF